MKKFISIIVAAIMIMALIATPAFSANQTTHSVGSITINGISEGNTYEIYKLLDLESYDTTTGAYSYKVNDAWTAFFATEDALDYVSVNAAGYVTWKAATNDSTVAAFAKLALAFAKAQTPAIVPVKSTANAGDYETVTGGIKFSGLALGYYLIDSTMGALCGLTTTNPDASINAKNGSPTITKTVKEDLDGQFKQSNTADIGQAIEYRVTIKVHQGAQNYVLHDTMSAGITFNGVTEVKHIVSATNTEEIATAGTEYNVVTTGITDGCSFEIHFTDAFCEHLATNDNVVIYYTATLNENAVIAGDGNTNTASLSFGEGHTTAEAKVTTYTYAVDIVKTDAQNNLIDGASFKIYDAATGGNEIKVVWDSTKNVYRRAKNDVEGAHIAVTGGKVRVVGLDNGNYYLEETDNPDGYEKLTARQSFVVSDGNLDAVFNDGIYSTGSGVHVVNRKGTMLPETGGIGTTLFVTLGGLTVLATGVVLFAKKRMSQIAE